MDLSGRCRVPGRGLRAVVGHSGTGGVFGAGPEPAYPGRPRPCPRQPRSQCAGPGANVLGGRGQPALAGLGRAKRQRDTARAERRSPGAGRAVTGDSPGCKNAGVHLDRALGWPALATGFGFGHDAAAVVYDRPGAVGHGRQRADWPAGHVVAGLFADAVCQRRAGPLGHANGVAQHARGRARTRTHSIFWPANTVHRAATPY